MKWATNIKFTKLRIVSGIMLVLIHLFLMWNIKTAGLDKLSIYTVLDSILVLPVSIFVLVILTIVGGISEIFSFNIARSRVFTCIFIVLYFLATIICAFMLGIFVGFLIEKLFTGKNVGKSEKNI
jgi:uncharacterized membrane protein